MRHIPPAEQTLLDGFTLTLAMCLKLTRRDGVVLGFTEHDRDLTISAVTYRSAVGFDWTALRRSTRLEEERTALEGLLSSATGGITESDARIGLYNNALLDLFVANWSTSTLVAPLKYGRLASLYPQGAGYVAEFQSLGAKLFKNEILRTISPDCDADLGDARCTFPLASFNGTITSVTSAGVVVAAGFVGPSLQSDLLQGKFVFTSGTLQWFTNRIKQYINGSKTFTLAIPFPTVPLVGWTFTAFEGCDKKFSTCKDRFDNVVNFRGFPHVPTHDRLKNPAQGGGTWGNVFGP